MTLTQPPDAEFLELPDLDRPPYRQHKVPKWHLVTSLALMGPIPLEWLRLVLALVREQWRIAVVHQPDKVSHHEAYVQSTYRTGAEKVRDRGVQAIGKIAARVDQLLAQIAILEREIENLERDPVTGPHGELLDVQTAAKRHEQLDQAVQEENERGGLRNRRTPIRLRRRVALATGLDFPVLMYFISGVFNVDWDGVFALDRASIGSTALDLVTTVIFAALGSVGVGVGLYYFGRTLRGHRKERGQLELRGSTPGLPVVFAALSVLIMIGAGLVMAFRIVMDAEAAGVSGVAAWLLGGFFAVLTVTVNLVVFSAHYLDGSVLTEQIDHLAARVTPARVQQANLRRQIDKLEQQVTLLRRAANRIGITTKAQINAAFRGAEQLILLARGYHKGCGWEGTAPSLPVVDLKPLTDMLASLDEPWPQPRDEMPPSGDENNDDPDVEQR